MRIRSYLVVTRSRSTVHHRLRRGTTHYVWHGRRTGLRVGLFNRTAWAWYHERLDPAPVALG